MTYCDIDVLAGNMHEHYLLRMLVFSLAVLQSSIAATHDIMYR